jgi:hypothetical protein
MTKNEIINKICEKHYPQPERGSESIKTTNARCGLKLLLEQKWVVFPLCLEDITKIIKAHYPNKVTTSHTEVVALGKNIMKLIGDIKEVNEEIKAHNATSGDLPLHESHMCYKDGHAMLPVYSFQHEKLAHGLNKCYRCGWEEEWQYDF